LIEELRNEAPLYAKLIPELPRLLVDFLKGDRSGSSEALNALLLEQRRTNRLLQALVYGCFGFVLGVFAMQLVGRFHHF
jgi:ubiquinone biosynthesis protein